MKYVVVCAKLLLLFLDTSKSIRTILHFLNHNTSDQSSRTPSCQVPSPCIVRGVQGPPSNMKIGLDGIYRMSSPYLTYLNDFKPEFWTVLEISASTGCFMP